MKHFRKLFKTVSTQLQFTNREGVYCQKRKWFVKNAAIPLMNAIADVHTVAK